MIRVLDNALIKLRWTCNLDLHGRENVGVGMDSVIPCMGVERGSGGMKRAAMKVIHQVVSNISAKLPKI